MSFSTHLGYPKCSNHVDVFTCVESHLSFFFPFHNYAPVCVSLLYKIQIKCFEVSRCTVTKSEE